MLPFPPPLRVRPRVGVAIGLEAQGCIGGGVDAWSAPASGDSPHQAEGRQGAGGCGAKANAALRRMGSFANLCNQSAWRATRRMHI